MKKVILALNTIVLLASASIGIHAQEGKKNDKNKTTTIDAWRQALPQSEVNPNDLPAPLNEPQEVEENVESAAEIEKNITGLEMKLMTALKQGDSATLSYLLADDFVPVGEMFNDSQADKLAYINWASKNSNLKSHKLDKIIVRVYGTTAVTTVHYKNQEKANGSSINEDFIVTDVWVKRGSLWQAVSHHISRIPKSQ
ncbi:MAG: nuclear transport factor 2 family protein [Acidobacteriota bacterium]|jgi:ketosteroid isomerase-like protein|nr:nuclear transport factor 2 family protein [Acidobacteriota bacterium]